MPRASGVSVGKTGLMTDHPVLVLDSPIDLACVETQLSTGVREEADERDCELIEGSFGVVHVPL